MFTPQTMQGNLRYTIKYNEFYRQIQCKKIRLRQGKARYSRGAENRESKM